MFLALRSEETAPGIMVESLFLDTDAAMNLSSGYRASPTSCPTIHYALRLRILPPLSATLSIIAVPSWMIPTPEAKKQPPFLKAVFPEHRTSSKLIVPFASHPNTYTAE